MQSGRHVVRREVVVECAGCVGRPLCLRTCETFFERPSGMSFICVVIITLADQVMLAVENGLRLQRNSGGAQVRRIAGRLAAASPSG